MHVFFQRILALFSYNNYNMDLSGKTDRYVIPTQLYYLQYIHACIHNKTQ